MEVSATFTRDAVQRMFALRAIFDGRLQDDWQRRLSSAPTGVPTPDRKNLSAGVSHTGAFLLQCVDAASERSALTQRESLTAHDLHRRPSHMRPHTWATPSLPPWSKASAR
jgi:hypothetical protein